MLKKIKKYGAQWCGPCHTFEKTLERVGNMDEFKDIVFESADIDDEENDDVEKYGIRSIPTTILFDENDEVIYKLTGNIPFDGLVNILREYVNNTEDGLEEV